MAADSQKLSRWGGSIFLFLCLFSQSWKPKKTDVGYRSGSVEDRLSSRLHQKLIRTPLFVPAAVGFLNNSVRAFTYTIGAYVPSMFNFYVCFHFLPFAAARKTNCSLAITKIVLNS